ncbi:uncharacterized protein LOC129256101 isoform X1 [Lytechinus pictus]|uniref:uncharacterized protein LOC129256101 isoform X1 n=1 Tax=Lytechinus pictus TaxID=7653 RepID=UPI00240CEC47|nr:uncharacterized protein LOC129256101 [Lytechinus pictus]
MKHLTMLQSILLRLQLQMLGIFHWAPIHWRHRCLLCSNHLEESKADPLFEPQAGNKHNEEAELHDREFLEDMDESAGLFPSPDFRDESSKTCWDEDEGSENTCAVCESLQWNREGDVTRNIKEWLPGPYRRAIGTVVSMLFMIVLTVGMCYMTVLYFCYLFGREDEVMHLTSFMSFSISLSSVALICVYGKVRYYFNGYGKRLDMENIQVNWGWSEMMHQDFMTRRLQYLCGPTGFHLPGIPFHVACLLWPVVNMVFEIVYFNSLSQLQPVINLMFAIIEVLSVTAGMLLYGVFCHTIFHLRCSFEIECNLLLAFFIENEGYLDRCRMRLAETYRDYRIFQSAVRSWVAFIVSIGILGLTIHLSWNYDVYSGNEKLNISSKDLILLNVLIFSEKLMIISLPVIAVGGMDLSYLWRHFQLALSRNRRSKQEYFWDRLIYYLRDMKENDQGTGVTAFLSVVSLYTGLKLGAQNLDYSGVLGH